MNYLAQSYDHRIIDGREAVLSLVAIKEALEDPARLLLDLEFASPPLTPTLSPLTERGRNQTWHKTSTWW